MSQKLGIKFTDYGQIYYFSSGAFVVEKGAQVIVKTEQGMGLGEVVTVSGDEEVLDEDLSTIYRLANEKDLESRSENLELAREAFRHCRSCIANHKLDMKLVDVEVFFDRSKMIFYFTAPGRIDFRELIKDLVREYRTRIELRQIGVRHETQMLGAIGNCGQMCCCRRFMRKFVPVTIKMAKEQNLFLNPTKISGICGRLLCCLSFEQEGYEEFNRKCPKVGKRYRTSQGMAKVIRVNFFRKTLTAIMEDGSDKEILVDDWDDFLNNPPVSDGDESGPSEYRKPVRQQRDRGEGRGRQRDDRKDRPRKPRKGKPRDDESREESGREAKSRDDKSRDGRAKDGQPRDRKPRDGKPRDRKSRDGKPREDRSRDEKARADKPKEPRSQDGKPSEQHQGDGQQGKEKGESRSGKRRPRRRRRRPRKKPQS